MALPDPNDDNHSFKSGRFVYILEGCERFCGWERAINAYLLHAQESGPMGLDSGFWNRLVFDKFGGQNASKKEVAPE